MPRMNGRLRSPLGLVVALAALIGLAAWSVPNLRADRTDPPSPVEDEVAVESGALDEPEPSGGLDQDDLVAHPDLSTGPPHPEVDDQEPSPSADDGDDGVADPSGIRIPAIDVDARVIPVGLLGDGAMEVPDFGLSGWYTKGPRPGEVGPAVIVAHVDSRAGPDVFFRLHELKPGDHVHVDLEDGSTLTFEVEQQEQTPKDDLPVERIWGATEDPTLRLITCDGFFDRSIGHYQDNRIVYLSLVEG